MELACFMSYQVFRLSSYVGSFGYIVLFFEIVFCGFVLYFFYNCIKLLRKERLKYFKVKRLSYIITLQFCIWYGVDAVPEPAECQT